MDMSVHSWQICVKKMCISKGISCRPIRQMQRTYAKVVHEIHPNVTKVPFFPVLFFSNNFRFTSYKYVTFRYPKVHRTTYLIVISIDDLAPNRPQIRIWYGILTWINQLTAIAVSNVFYCFCYLSVIFLRDSRLMFIYHRHILFCT